RSHARTRPPPPIRTPNPPPIHRIRRPKTLRLQATSRISLLAPPLPRLQRLLTSQTPRKTPLPAPKPRSPRPRLHPSRIPLVQLPNLRHPHPRQSKNQHRNGCPMIPEGYRGVSPLQLHPRRENISLPAINPSTIPSSLSS